MVSVGELIERLKDEGATFTRDETTSLIDWYVTIATNKDIHDMRVTIERETLQAVKDANTQALRTLLDSWDNRPTTPTLQVVSYEQA